MRSQTNQRLGPGRNRKGQPMGQRTDGPNWAMLAGGIIVTAVSVVIGRRQRQSEGGKVEDRGDKSGKAQLANHHDIPEPMNRHSPGMAVGAHQDSQDDRVTQLPQATPVPGNTGIQPHLNGLHLDSRLDGAGPSFHSQFQFHSQRSRPAKRPAPPTSSPPSPLLCDEATSISVTPSPTQENGQSSPHSFSALRTGISGKRDMVHRLRQQLKSRDEMIFDMQSHQDQVMGMHHTRTADLQARLEATSKALFESNREVQRLQRALAGQGTKPVAISHNFCGSVGGGKLTANEMDRSRIEALMPDVKALVWEARRLAGEVMRLEGEKRETEQVGQAMSKQYEALVHKVQKMEADLEVAKKSGLDKDCRLETNEKELLKFTHALHDLQLKLDSQTRELETTRNNQPSRLADARSANSEQKSLGRSGSSNSCSKASSRSTGVADGASHHAGNVVRSYTMLFSRNPDQSNSGVSSSEAGLKTGQGPTLKGLSSGTERSEATDGNVDSGISERLVVALQQEVDQLSTALATQSKVVTETREATGRLIDEFQSHDTTVGNKQKWTDAAPKEPNPEEPNWGELSQHLSFSTSATSAAQVQELSHKLEQVAKQQRVEEEMAELTKHQAKIAELKHRVAKLTAKCHLLNARASEDEVRDEHTLRVAALILELANKLAVQEEQARQTSIQVQRLSASFQLSSPFISRSKKEDLQKLLQERSNPADRPTESNGQWEHSLILAGRPTAQPRYIAGQEQKPKKNGASLFDRHILFSSAESARPSTNPEPTHHVTPGRVLKQPYQFRLGTPSKVRRVLSIKDRKSSLTKQDHGSGSRQDMTKLLKRGNSLPARVEFGEVEVTSGILSGILEMAENPQTDITSSSSTGDCLSSEKPFQKENFLNDAMTLQQPVKRNDPSYTKTCSQDTNSASQQAGEKEAQENSEWSMEEEVARLTLEIEQVMAETSAVALTGSPIREKWFSPTFSDNYSPEVRIGSPTVTGDLPTPRLGLDATSSTLRRLQFISDKIPNNHVLLGQVSSSGAKRSVTEEISSANYSNLDYLASYSLASIPGSAALSPFSKMMACLDLQQPSPATSLEESESHREAVSEVPGEINRGGSRRQEADEPLTPPRSPEIGGSRGSESIGSVDSAFNEILDHTLDDLVRVCSTATTSAGTPTSSSLSHGQDGRNGSYF